MLRSVKLHVCMAFKSLGEKHEYKYKCVSYSRSTGNCRQDTEHRVTQSPGNVGFGRERSQCEVLQVVQFFALNCFVSFYIIVCVLTVFMTCPCPQAGFLPVSSRSYSPLIKNCSCYLPLLGSYTMRCLTVR
jgi:hypothetical protein